MTQVRGEARSPDNRRLLGLTIGSTYVPMLAQHVSWEGHGERAASILLPRLHGVKTIVSQPRGWRVHGRKWTPDYRVELHGSPFLIVELKGHKALQDPKVRDKLTEAEHIVAAAGHRLIVLDSAQLAYSAELRNVQLIRRYARRKVSSQIAESVLSGFRERESVELGVLAAASLPLGIAREDLYALLYHGVLDLDWSVLLDEQSLISAAVPVASAGVLPLWLRKFLWCPTQTYGVARFNGGRP